MMAKQLFIAALAVSFLFGFSVVFALADPTHDIGDETIIIHPQEYDYKRGTREHDEWWCGVYKDEGICPQDEQVGCKWIEGSCKPVDKP